MFLIFWSVLPSAIIVFSCLYICICSKLMYTGTSLHPTQTNSTRLKATRLNSVPPKLIPPPPRGGRPHADLHHGPRGHRHRPGGRLQAAAQEGAAEEEGAGSSEYLSPAAAGDNPRLH